MKEREEHEIIGDFLRQALPDDLPEAVAQNMQKRLSAFRERFDAAPSESSTLIRPWNRMTKWLRGLSMKQRIAFSGVSAAAVVGLILFWGSSGAKRLSAMEQMVKNIRQATSCKVTMTMKIPLVRDPKKPPVIDERSATVYWLAPNSYRMEDKGGAHSKGLDETSIFPAGKPGIRIDHTAKKFVRLPPMQVQMSRLMIFDKLSKFSGEADHKLDPKEIDGKKAWGFEIDGKKIDPDAYPGPVTIWVDPETNLPVSLRYEMKSLAMPAPMVIQMDDFHWNIDFAQAFFQAEAPKGYVEQQKNATEYPPPEKVLEGIVFALKTYSELCGGHYPNITRTFAEPVADEMYKAAGVSRPPRTIEAVRDKKYQRVLEAQEGFFVFNRVLMYNPDAVYYGRTVGPGDKDKVLLHWKLDDGRYQVIFGNLTTEVVSRDRLRALEGK